MGARTFSFIALLGVLGGCVTARVRGEAHLTLQCPEDQVQLVEKRPGTWEVVGCGRMAVCSLPEVEGAEVSCVGGAPIREKQ